MAAKSIKYSGPSVKNLSENEDSIQCKTDRVEKDLCEFK